MSGMFSLGGSIKTAQVVENTNQYLRAGVHDVIFKGIEKAEGYDAFDLKFEAENGATHSERMFEPKEGDAERTENQYGTNPSRVEQFLGKIKQIIVALDPELGKKIETEGEKFSAPNFDGFIKLLKKYLDPKIGTKTQIKLIPNGKYTSFPGFPMGLTKDGVLIIRNRVIGDNLTLTAKETQQIADAIAAKPTNMRPSPSNELDDLKAEFGGTEDSIDDLPF